VVFAWGLSIMRSYDREYLTADELAVLLQAKRETILDWHRSGRIPAIRITSKVLRFDYCDVLTSLKRGSTAEEAGNE